MFILSQGKNKPNDQSLLLGDAERLRWFLLPSEAHVFLRGEKRDGYPRVPPFTPLRRSYYGEMKDEVTEHNDEGENRECEQKNCSGFTDEIEMCEEKRVKEKSESEECNETIDNDIRNSEVDKNSREGSLELENNVVMKCSTEDCRSIKQNQHVKFHNPPRHVFNLTVKVC